MSDSRSASVKRVTNETTISAELKLDGTGRYDIETGVGFLDHMLEQLSRHSLIDMTVRAKGDLHIDAHHTTEDCGWAIGEALTKALGDRKGINRYGSSYLPMDEALSRVALDCSNRPFLVWRATLPAQKLGEMDTELFREFFQAFSQAAGLTLHIENLYGDNTHHIVESIFKGVGRALRQAVEIDPKRADAVPSTKGTLGGVAVTAAGGPSSVAVVDYGSGNLRSVAKAFERVASERGPGTDVVVTSDPAVVRRAGRIVLPGVGAFADCRGGLYGLPGMVEALTDAVIGQGTPFLGICVGMQLMAERGLEHVVSDGLGWIGGEVKLMTPAPAPDGLPLKVPHMGWNRLNLLQPEHPLLKGIEEGAFVYYVHSYLFDVADRTDLAAVSDYGGEIAAVVGRKNYFGTQFHPEKSQANGLAFIRNFLDWRP